MTHICSSNTKPAPDAVPHRPGPSVIPHGPRLAAIFVCLVLATQAIAAQSAVARDGLTVPSQPGREEITAAVARLKAMTAGDAFAKKPVFKAPYAAGTLNKNFLDEGLTALNMYRFVAGIPASVSLDPDWNDIAQYGAVLLQVMNKGLDHTPAFPSGIGMTRAFYDRGYLGTSTSNLSQGASPLSATVWGYMDDSDDSNIDRLGHRRWALSPGMTKVGFGYTEEYSSMKVFGDDDRDTDMAYTAWPPVGNMPLSLFYSGLAWSFSLNPDVFGGKVTGTKSTVKVSMVRQSDGKTWNLGGTGRSQGYFNIETSGFGLAYCVIFRPDGLGRVKDGETFSITISGVKDAQGKAIPIAYKTTLFSDVPEIEVKLASTHPKKPTMTVDWLDYRDKRIVVSSDKGEINFGWTGKMIQGFSFALDTPDGVIPISVVQNKADSFGPGEFGMGPPKGISSISLVGNASGYSLTYVVFAKSKGWSKWAGIGETLGFDDGTPIEVIQINLEN